ncbi:MAG: hypothetical protein ACLU8D_05120 [Enterocloster sp.]
MHDEKVPGEADGLYPGGGYPELYGKELSENASMRASVRERLAQGMPCIAECGGYLYLKQELWMRRHLFLAHAVCFQREAGTAGLSRFGYDRDGHGRQCPGACRDQRSQPTNSITGTVRKTRRFSFKKPVGTREWSCGYGTESLYAGFPHLYFYGHEPVRFLELAAWRRTGSADDHIEHKAVADMKI